MASVISAELQNVPLSDIIGAPLESAVEAQRKSAESTLDFIESVGLDGDTVRNVTFNIKTDEVGVVKSLEVPLLTMVPVPSLRIKELRTSFDFKIRSTEEKEEHASASGKFRAKYGFGSFSVRLKGSVAKSSKSGSTIEKNANLSIEVLAVQDEIPKGLATLLDILNNQILEKKQEKPKIAT